MPNVVTLPAAPAAAARAVLEDGIEAAIMRCAEEAGASACFAFFDGFCDKLEAEPLAA